MAGSAKTEQLDASWELSFGSDEEPLFHLARDWMYRAPVPKTKLLTPYPGARFDGVVRAGEREVRLDGWRGMIGHNWGSQHAERWIWLHGAGFDEAEDAWLDAAIGRIKLGLVTTPWIANGTLYIDGERHRLGGPEKAREHAGDRDRRRGATSCCPAASVTVSGRVESEREELRRLGLRGPGRARAQHGQLLDRRHDAHAERRRRARTASCTCAAAPPTSSACARPTTACRCSRSRDG